MTRRRGITRRFLRFSSRSKGKFCSQNFMISHQYKCIFIHIPKAAGTSIEFVLRDCRDLKRRGTQDHRAIWHIQPIPLKSPMLWLKPKILPKLARKAKENVRIKRKRLGDPVLCTRRQFAAYTKFAVVRNPWARAVSWYRNVIRDPIHRKNFGVVETTSFEEFMFTFAGKGALRPQTCWLKGWSGVICLDEILRFERLDEDFERISRKLGLKVKKLPHKIESERYDFREFYNERLEKLVSEIYREEIQLFDYKLRD